MLRVGHFNDDNNADLLCDDAVNGIIKLITLWEKVKVILLKNNQLLPLLAIVAKLSLLKSERGLADETSKASCN